MKAIKLLLIIFGIHTSVMGQELFPNTEPASTMPKGVIGLRAMYETYKELPSQRTKYWNGLRFMYGATGKLTLMLTASASNHHFAKFPADLQNYFLNHHRRVYKPNPFLFEGFNLYTKYRVLSIDDKQKHLRVALYGEAAHTFVPHDEAEPWLLGDNSGVGGGVIGTHLVKRFAISVTAGLTHPFVYKDKEQKITFKSGDAWNYNLALGYRLLPIRYSGYQNMNVNLYVEFINKSYEGAQMTLDGKPYSFSYLQGTGDFVYYSLQGNRYSEIRPSIQLILNSNNRLDIGLAQPLYNKSYQHFYPMFFFHFQKYFYPKTDPVKI